MRNQSAKRTAGAAKSGSLMRDATALYDAMTELLRVYMFRDRDRLGYHGLTVTQCYVLDVLAKRGQLTLNELVAEMQLDKSTLSRVVDGLEAKRAVKRAENPEDGRSILIVPTRSGLASYERVVQDIVAENAGVLSELSPAARRQAIALVDQLGAVARRRHLDAAD